MGFFVKKRKWIIAFLLVVVFFLVVAEQKNKTVVLESTSERIKGSPALHGDRVLGINVSEGAIGFEKAFALAQDAGIEVLEIALPWDEYETKPGKYTDKWLPQINYFYPRYGTRIALSLNPIDTNNLRLPKDLKEKTLNDPLVIERYRSFVGFVASKLPDAKVFYVAIGNEVDVTLGTSEQRWREYTEFYRAVAPFVEEKFPQAVIGSKVTFESALRQSDSVKQLGSDQDELFVTYYPFEPGGFQVRDEQSVHNDFKRILDLYPDKKIYFTEIGYPSGKDNGSSEEKQAEFIKQAFIAWDNYATRVPYLNFLWLHDKSKKEVAEFERYYGISDKGFLSFLGTLGFRTYEGEDKPAYRELRKSAQERGW